MEPTQPPTPALEELAARWASAAAGQRYRRARGALRRADRDGRSVRAWLAEELAGSAGHGAWLLDCPAGSGRLFPALAALPLRYLGLDASRPMLAAHPAGAHVCLARLERLPLADQSIDWVLCNRLLHHLPDGPALESALAELWRVARTGLCFSWFDARSWPAWRQRWRGRTRDPAGRFYLSRQNIAAACARAGLPPPEFRAQSGWFSAQSFALVRRPRQPSA